MTPRTPLDEEDYKLLVRARNSAHGWLLENCKEPPAVPFGPQGVLVDLKGEDGQPTELPPQVLPTPHHWIRKKVELIATIGAPAGEDPASAAGLVRQFLREVLATLNEPRRAVMLEELRKTVSDPKHPTIDMTWMLDFSKQKKAHDLLVRHAHHVRAAAKLMVEEARIRQSACAASELPLDDGGAGEQMIGLAKVVERSVLELERRVALINSQRPLRTAAELVQFRGRWRTRLSEVRLSREAIDRLLGEEAPKDQDERAHRVDRHRKHVRRDRKGRK